MKSFGFKQIYRKSSEQMNNKQKARVHFGEKVGFRGNRAKQCFYFFIIYIQLFFFFGKNKTNTTYDVCV